MAARAFGIDPQSLESLCPYGPVYKFSAFGHSWVLKRTGYPHSDAASIAAWLTVLRHRRVSVVAPDPLFSPNPRKLRDTDIHAWVVYPFIPGSSYTGKVSQIAQAGLLLGNMHAQGADLGDAMMTKDVIKRISSTIMLEQVEESISLAGPALASNAAARFRVFTETFFTLAGESTAAGLPCAACSWDFKASNLVFRSTEDPMLVDPDHAGYIPRLYDLACALLLFHCDHSPGPRRLWRVKEWQSFLEAYCTRIVLSAGEIDAWPHILAMAWINEALWLLAHFAEGWKDEEEVRYLIDLAFIDFSIFSLTA